MSIEDAMKLTVQRVESFKKYTTECGSLFMNHPQYKHYLKLPYVLEKMPKGDYLLEELLSDQYPVDLRHELEEEIDLIIFYQTKITKNRSFLTKAFEYNLRHNKEFNTRNIE